MNDSKRLLITTFVIALIIVISGSILYLTNKKSFSPNEQSSSKNIENAQPVQVVDEAVVSITSSGFVPSAIKVKKGTVVRWVNTDSALHQVSSDPHPTHTGLAGFDSEEGMQKDDSYAFTFENAGTFSYHDHLNPLKFKGSVIVE